MVGLTIRSLAMPPPATPRSPRISPTLHELLDKIGIDGIIPI